jgi:tetratricopeptide (TPR) repeat protein
MKSKIFCLLLQLVCFTVLAQTPDTKQMHETAKTFMRQGDYANAIVVLNRARQQDGQNLAVNKDLALSYYFQSNYKEALEIITPLLDRDDVDDQCFQIAGSIYKQLNRPDDCEKLYKKGLKKFPQSGALYNELGELLWSRQDYDAIKRWEEGIEKDPSYSKNYYNAAMYYYLTTDRIWSLLYGEIFVNMEPLSSRSPEIKEILAESYKKLFSVADQEQIYKSKNSFEKAFLKTMLNQTPIVSSGINVDALIMIRTRFILDWMNDSNKKYPFRLFEYHRQLLQEGLFEAYNQWLFGASQNLPQFQSWVSAHNEEYSQFTDFQKGRIFRVPLSQYYH